MLHFTDMQSLVEEGTTLIDRGEGVFVFDTDGRRYIDGLSGLYCTNLGHSYGEEIGSRRRRADGAPAVHHELDRRPPGSGRTGDEAGGAGAGGDRARLLHLGRGGIGRVGLEARGPVPRGERRTGAAQGDRPRGRLPRGDLGGAGDDRPGRMPGTVRAARRARRPRRQHQPLPPPGGGRPGADARLAPGRGGGDDRPRGGGDDRDADRRAGPERGRLPGPAGRLLGRACARSATATASCSSPTR